jgi:glycosyltransferase involved in cell wall biosynthesis|nr:MAG: hypothetical protein DIU62_13230 [Pseudomonadota bacterium]
MPPHVCFVGLGNLPVLAPEFGNHGAGGEELQHTLLARALARRGYRVSMIVGDYGQPDGASWDGVTTHIAYDPAAGLPGLRFVHPRWIGLWSAARRADADIYYVSCAGMQVGELALFARRHGRRVVFRVAHDDDCVPHRLVARLDAGGLRFWLHTSLYRYGLAHADAVLVQSSRQHRLLKEHFGREATIATMLVEPPRRVPDFAARDIDVLWVNNIRAFKRADLAVDLAGMLDGLRMHMIGGAQPRFESLYADIERRAAALPHLTFHGPVPYHQVNGFYERARVFVNTSDSEGFPNSYLQAWARGVPVVAFFDPDGVIAREGLGRAVRGLAEMQQAVRELAGNPAAWQAASQRCRAFMAREYGEDRILAPYMSAFDEVAPRAARAPMMAR